MDVIKQPTERHAKQRRRIVVIGAAAAMVVAVVYGASKLESGVPNIDKAGLWIGTVEHGPMKREIRAVGTLVSEDDASLWLSAEVDVRVDRRLLDEGASVTPDTVILQLSNPDVEQASISADLALQAAQASYASLEATLQNELFALRAGAARVDGERAAAVLQAEAEASLVKDGIIPKIKSQQSAIQAQSLTTMFNLETDRVRMSEKTVDARLAVQRAEVASRRTFAALKRRDLQSLTVRAGMKGVLQQVVVDAGQRVSRSANLARVVDPSRLKAQLRIPEAQTADLRAGLDVSIDTRNGIVPGVISRIAAAAQNGTVTVDIRLKGALPSGARPDMTIDGVIEIERLDDVLHVGRPVTADLSGEFSLYRLSADGSRAERVPVKVGRAAATEIEIIGGGLRAGDKVVLSDTSSWGDHAQVRLRL
jgi:HlyD family secretion protein